MYSICGKFQGIKFCVIEIVVSFHNILYGSHLFEDSVSYYVATCIYIICMILVTHLSEATMYLRISGPLLKEKYYSEIPNQNDPFAMDNFNDGL